MNPMNRDSMLNAGMGVRTPLTAGQALTQTASEVRLPLIEGALAEQLDVIESIEKEAANLHVKFDKVLMSQPIPANQTAKPETPATGVPMANVLMERNRRLSTIMLLLRDLAQRCEL